MENQMTKEFALNVSPVSGQVYAGNIRHLGNGKSEAVGARHDVTKFMPHAVIQYLDGGCVLEVGGRYYAVEVTELTEAEFNAREEV